jgi:hypothetical protein
MKEFKVNFALCDSEYLTAVRLVVGAICALHDVDVDSTEDFKVCVTECCIILKNCGYESVTITFEKGQSVCATVCGEGGKPVGADNELSLSLISALVSSCEIENQGEAIGKVTLKI